jgi:RNA polymerase sigma-70 factor (ECF subfamily)
MEATDAHLIKDFRRGDPAAFERLAARWEDKAHALAYRLTLDQDQAADIVQAAFLRAFQSLGKFDGRASFSTWLYRIVLNLCRDRQRTANAWERAISRFRTLLRANAKGSPSPADTAEKSDTGRRVAEAVASLPTDIREVLIMRHYEGLRFSQIADVQNAPVSTIKSRMVQGLRLLRDELKDLAP